MTEKEKLARRTREERLTLATSTFTYNMTLPVHRWFRFPAGFSAEWVRTMTDKLKETGKDIVLLDPFAGVGTAVLAGEQAGVPAYGLEAQPFIARIANAKLLWHTDANKFRAFANAVLERAKRWKGELPQYAKLIHKCYPDDILRDLHSLRHAWESLADSSPASELAWLALTSILRVCSPVGTAPWQYILPSKSKSHHIAPYQAFEIQAENIASDMTLWQSQGVEPKGRIFCSDARKCAEIGNNCVSLILTSPPYANNYDYADATRLEMSFFGEVKEWGDLHEKARRGLIRSCSQHVSIEGIDLTQTLKDLSDMVFLLQLEEVCRQLSVERLQHGGKKDYHLMVAAYFTDMKQVWNSLRRVCRDGATVCFVIGDSAPYGVYVPVDRWMGELALAAGFKSFHFEKLRDRNIKWRNRKHRVPLHEGRLWVEG